MNMASIWRPLLTKKTLANQRLQKHFPKNLIQLHLKQIKTDAPKVPVSTAQTSDFWLNDASAAALANKCDFIAVNIYPHWNWNKPDANNQPKLQLNSLTPQQGFDDFEKQYDDIAKKYPGKQIVVTETGWPTTYGNTPNPPPIQYQKGLDNAHSYFKLIKDWSDKNQVVVYYYSMFDDWYGVNATSQYNMHFGLLNTDRSKKGANA